MIPNSYKKRNNHPYKYVLVRLGVVVLAVLLVALVLVDIKIYQRKKEFNAQIESLQQKVAHLKNQNAGLQESTVRANEEDYIEKIAREELDLQKPEEKVISFVTAESDQPAPQQQNPVQSWLGWISGWFKK